MLKTILMSGSLLLATAPAALGLQASEALPAISSATAGMETRDGLLRLHVDNGDGRILASLRASGDGHYGEMIYTARLTSGLGSNPIGIDRGLGTSSEILRFFRVNDRIFAEFANTQYVALDAPADEQRATAQSFGRSVIWSTDILAESDGEVLIDLSEFLKRDAIGTIDILSNANEGSFSVDGSRSAALTDSALAFPQNVEIDALLTLQSSNPGREVQAVSPVGNAVTLTVHHTFVALPEAGYQPRLADDRSGAITRDFYNMASPLEDPVRSAYAIRHRLERVDPSAQSGPVVEPIVYYVDRGAPPMIRDALIEGGNWWADAFEAAGFEDAYRVELLPEGVHPLDVRYNVIQWVHRQTRGWSYGASVVDPRTGEIIKGHVILGSQRVRQDRMIFEGLLGVENTASGADDDPLQIALARIRQLSAHEIGHTIGLAHNFAASTNDRASVMDYPAPLVTALPGNRLDISDAYDVGIGEWDTASIRWLYTQTDETTDEAAALNAILDEARDAGLLYITDRHARGNNAAHPLANLWDNGEDPISSLENVMAVRRLALDGFGPHTLANGLPTSELRAVFPPLYLYHRYQVEAAGKTLGGVYFDYEINRAGNQGLRPETPERQRAALAALTATLAPSELDVRDEVLAMMAPSPFSDYDPAATRELFVSNQYPAFDRSMAASASARLTLAAMLSSARLSRIADQSARDAAQLAPTEVFDAIEATAFAEDDAADTRLAPIAAAVQREYVDRLLALAGGSAPVPAGLARNRLDMLARMLDGRRGSRVTTPDQRVWLLARIEAGLAQVDAGESAPSSATRIPPGSPIGSADSCWHCDSADLLGLQL